MSQYAIEVDGLCVSHGDREVVSDVSFKVKRGEIFGLLGTNGAGKTTTLETLQSYYTPSSGTVKLFGLSPFEDAPKLRSMTGFMMQEAGLIGELTPAETLAYWQNMMSRGDDPERLLKAVGLMDRRDTRVESLSGGEKRRLDLALTIWGSPELVVLDEPTTGLDADSRSTLWSLIKGLADQGATVVLTTHYLEEAQALAETVAIMDSGRVVVEGSVQDILSSRPQTVSATADRDLASRLTAQSTLWVSREIGGGRCEVSCSTQDAIGAVRELFDTSTPMNSEFTDLEVTKVSLEDVFLEISSSEQQHHDTREALECR